MRVDGQFVQPLADVTRMLDRELCDVLVQSLLRRMRDALLEGQSLEVPNIGHISVRQTRPYALVNPVSGQAQALGGERTLLFRPDRQLVRDLNNSQDNRDA
ncbi:HU family DNA-binding protein [Caulobacter sp.]|uniref:HU family DNA-binding protein n=1 Tax=Caulobacter sp. TaxID=78 RepID=UPI0016200A5D